MKKEQLKQIIKEELQAMLNEMGARQRAPSIATRAAKRCRIWKQDYNDANSAVAMNPADVVAVDRRERIVQKAKKLGCDWVNKL